jgi:lipoprotein NlpD
MKAMGGRTRTAFALLVLAIGLAGCASKTRAPAPVEDRSSGVRGAAVVATGEPARVFPGAENAGKPGYYTVRQGDTLIRIALEQGQNWRDIVRWNSIDNPNVIETGRVLRVSPPASETVVTRPVALPSLSASSTPPAGASSSPITASPPPLPAASAPRAAASAAPAVPVPSTATASPPAATPEDDIAWGWPAPGNTSVLATFDEVKNKGMDIAGKAGDPVLASADGRVVYAGAGLRGYGNLLILKHNNTYLTAYAHNQTLLVKEDQTVRKGQKIAEMGSSDTDRVKLHFEIRRQGKPVDPAKFLQASR